MAITDVYELRVSGTVNSEAFNLVFHALRVSGSFVAADVADACKDTALPDIIGMTSTSTIWETITAKNLGDPVDFAELSLGSTAGSQVGDTLGPFVAVVFHFPRLRSDMHHGYKRIPGVIETGQNNGVISGAYLTGWQAAAADVIRDWENLTAPGIPIANYIIVKRVLDAGVYRLPQTTGELIYYQPSSVVVRTNLSTQNSRKYTN